MAILLPRTISYLRVVKLVAGNAGRYGGTGNLNFIQFGSFCGVRIFGMGEAC